VATGTVASVALREWETVSPDTDEKLSGLFLDDLPEVRTLAGALTAAGKLEVLELKRGLSIRARAHVGNISLGRLSITIRPKLDAFKLLPLLRYAYRLRNFEPHGQTRYATGLAGLQDLLLQQLAAESTELFARGIHRHYERRENGLTAPRGRIDFRALMRQPIPRSTLPCIHHPRTENCLLNRVLCAGLRFGVHLTDEPLLRGRLRGMAALLEESVGPIPLNSTLLRRAAQATNRLTAAYRPALSLIEIVAHSRGITLDSNDLDLRLPGFLFDMNRFYQMLLSRFLAENLTGYKVQNEFRLADLFAYVPGYNPHSRRSPTPRPDFVILSGSRTAAVLDAKYRDLWSEELPREMLYQLTLYSMGWGGGGVATILYPTMHREAREARIEFRNPLAQTGKCQVVLRPVDMEVVAQLIAGDRRCQRGRIQYAQWLVFGKEGEA